MREVVRYVVRGIYNEVLSSEVDRVLRRGSEEAGEVLSGY